MRTLQVGKLTAVNTREFPGRATVLGLLPMLQDVFWAALAVTIFFGLIVGTLLTMVVIPTLYALLYGISVPKSGE